MKRSLEEDDGSGDETLVYSMTNPVGANPYEKRTRSGDPPQVIGPLVFTSQGHALHPALSQAQLSDQPGVYRLSAPPETYIRLWMPHFHSPPYIEVELQELLEAIDETCVLVFDTRPSDESPLLGGSEARGWLLSQPIIRSRGMVVSRLPPTEALPIPYIQDPTTKLAELTRYHEYLGQAAIFIRDNQVVATCLLNRSTTDLVQTFERWEAMTR